jgi:SAM-dependent methyltransferase
MKTAEFTGERVIPELVDTDLLNEHLSRYRFARQFIVIGDRDPALRILDAGCGSGYGTAELSAVASVIGTDISEEAIIHAHARYGHTGAKFLQAAWEGLPFADAAFDLVTAFEVIEHLDRWEELLKEANRVLTPAGTLLVSTPNRDYYAESRGSAGPNPYHRHEFDYEEFRQALEAIFPHVRLWTQNHAEAIVFSPQNAANTRLEASGSNDPDRAHFYLAACSQSPIAADSVFAWLPSSANLLRERERHIEKLNGELEKKDAWLRQNLEAHSELQRKHEQVTAELERQNVWASELNREIALRNSRIAELQNEQEVRLTWVARQESDIQDFKAQISQAAAEIERLRVESVQFGQECRSRIEELESTVAERTLWVRNLEAEVAGCRSEIARIESTAWFRVGAKLGLGPGK